MRFKVSYWCDQRSQDMCLGLRGKVDFCAWFSTFPLFLSVWLLLCHFLSTWTQISCCSVDTCMMDWVCSLTRGDKAGWCVLVYCYQMWNPAAAQQHPEIWGRSRVSKTHPSLCPSSAKQQLVVFGGLCSWWVSSLPLPFWDAEFLETPSLAFLIST